MNFHLCTKQPFPYLILDLTDGSMEFHDAKSGNRLGELRRRLSFFQEGSPLKTFAHYTQFLLLAVHNHHSFELFNHSLIFIRKKKRTQIENYNYSGKESERMFCVKL